MTEDIAEQDAVRLWAQRWKDFGPELEKIRLREVRDEDTLLSLRLLARAFNQARRAHPPGASPGLIEMQKYFARLRPASNRFEKP